MKAKSLIFSIDETSSIDVKLLHPEKAFKPISARAAGNSTEDKAAQERKVSGFIVVNESGRTTVFKLLQDLKAPFPNTTNEVGKFIICVKPEHNSNADVPITFSEDGK